MLLVEVVASHTVHEVRQPESCAGDHPGHLKGVGTEVEREGGAEGWSKGADEHHFILMSPDKEDDGTYCKCCPKVVRLPQSKKIVTFCLQHAFWLGALDTSNTDRDLETLVSAYVGLGQVAELFAPRPGNLDAVEAVHVGQGVAIAAAEVSLQSKDCPISLNFIRFCRIH